MSGQADDGVLGYGVIGIGEFMTGTVAPAIVADKASSLVAAVSRDQARADAFAETFDVGFATTSYTEMLDRPEVDAVFVTTPNALHAEQAIAAAQAGKHVLCDKPMALSAADASRIVDVCDAAGVTLGINFHYRHLPWVAEARRMISEGTLGVVQTVEIDVGSGTRNYTNWRADPLLAGLGSTYNVGVHMLDVLTVILGAEPVEVCAMFDEPQGSGKVEMQALILITFDNGTMAYVNCNERTAYPRNTMTVQGSRGRLVGTNVTRSREEGTLHLLTSDGEEQSTFPPAGAHQLCVTDFTRAVLGGTQPEATGADGLRSMRLCDAIARSARDRRHVSVEQP